MKNEYKIPFIIRIVHLISIILSMGCVFLFFYVPYSIEADKVRRENSIMTTAQLMSCIDTNYETFHTAIEAMYTHPTFFETIKKKNYAGNMFFNSWDLEHNTLCLEEYFESEELKAIQFLFESYEANSIYYRPAQPSLDYYPQKMIYTYPYIEIDFLSKNGTKHCNVIYYYFADDAYDYNHELQYSPDATIKLINHYYGPPVKTTRYYNLFYRIWYNE